ncbi:MAG TPA: hypothetical protein VHO69_12625 [Phototrophicaceae bacterium]|jgi:hypothetical protein|nr:hypothetical protein [Phototrophicaceae bacterium]
MNTTNNRNKHRQSGDATVVVIPGTLRYVNQMERCHQLAYGYEPGQGDDEDLTAEKYAYHLQIFPEGQFLALDTQTDLVIGMATSMQVNLPHDHSFIASWSHTTGGG